MKQPVVLSAAPLAEQAALQPVAPEGERLLAAWLPGPRSGQPSEAFPLFAAEAPLAPAQPILHQISAEKVLA